MRMAPRAGNQCAEAWRVETGRVQNWTAANNGARLEISWTLEKAKAQEPVLTLVWRESGVGLPADRSRKGFGRKLIEDALAFSLKAKTELAFAPDGLVCKIRVPLSEPAADNPSESR